MGSLKGGLPTEKIVQGAKVSRETIRKLERGIPVKLKTLEQVAASLRSSDEELLQLVIALIKIQFDRYADRLHIVPQPAENHARHLSAETLSFVIRFEQLSQQEKQAVLRIMESKEVISGIRAIINAGCQPIPSAKRPGRTPTPVHARETDDPWEQL